jgi:ATP-dependent Clp protease protease subunit
MAAKPPAPSDQPAAVATTPPQAVPANPPPTVAYVTFSAEIGVNTTESLIATMSNLVKQNFDEVVLLMSTPGGTVMNGVNLYNVLRAMPFKLTTHNVGNIDSIGNTVFLAGETRYACPHSTFMFHGVGIDAGQGVRLQEKILRERLASVTADQKRIGSILSERSNLTSEQIESLFLESQTKDAAYAVGCGIVHEVRDVQIPRGAPIFSLVFKR